MKELKLEDILTNTDFNVLKKVGYVAIIGRPNTGKSTFVNTLLGQKVSITSNIPQTTRKRVLAIYNDVDSQIIFFDTPGIHKSELGFNQKINNEAINSLKEADVVLHFIDSSRPYGEEEKQIENILKFVKSPILKVFSKIDLPLKNEINDKKNTFLISSLKNTGLNELIKEVKNHLNIGNLFYPEDYYTDQNIYFRISEIIREKVFLNTKEEIPHSIYVEVEEIDESDELLKIQSYIYTETDSQKYIIVGKAGSLITKIGSSSRLELEKIFEKKIFLSLKVKVMEKWRKNDKIIKQILK
ncbi:GTPase Era [Candidatus Gracilibacteria bacterium]|nr:GTPase Era [Candidatus Gracilibacteria bacterium]